MTLVDTSGAFPGIQAEERGQAEAIARSTEACLAAGVPVVSAIVGEGGSGGAVALAAGNRVLMFEHAVYSVISPEGCASILWRTADKAAEAAEANARDRAGFEELRHHRHHRDRAGRRRASRPCGCDRQSGDSIQKALGDLSGLGRDELKRGRQPSSWRWAASKE